MPRFDEEVMGCERSKWDHGIPLAVDKPLLCIIQLDIDALEGGKLA